MKSRWAKASVRRSVLEAPAPGATSSVVRRKTHAADPSPLAIVTAPRASGHAAPVARLHPAAMHPNTATWTKLSPQKSRMAPRLQMTRHEALSLFDETTEEPVFRAPHVPGRRQDESARRLEGAGELRKPTAELAEQLPGAPVARRTRQDARRVRGLDHRAQRRIDVERLRAELRLQERTEPARLGDDVRRKDHDAARRAWRVRLVGAEHAGAGSRA